MSSAPPVASPYSLFDADLPLLAVDAASEIESLLPEGHAVDQVRHVSDLPYTKELLNRLIAISANPDTVNVDSIMYEQSFLPTIGPERELFQQPTTVRERLEKLIGQHNFVAEQDKLAYLQKLRDFFLDVSSFSSASRMMLRRGSLPHPNATM